MSLRSDLKKLSPEDWRNERIKLRPLLTEDNLIYAACDCQLTEEQQERGNPAWFSIERAYLFPEASLPCLIENEQSKPIGFLNLASGQLNLTLLHGAVLSAGATRKKAAEKPPHSLPSIS